ncbi:alcohol dehydrogenase [Curtobacterium sp. S6]|uniref:alcohol dehydrogenase n=1 Tax=Curtobacterium sp. S6 TaxID=1479623 RepID=UPI0004AB423B|nr:alcohol dehydrogenase [Curtobacterium sp. S6]
MTHMTMVRVPEANAAFEVVEVPIPEPGPGQVRIKVAACGVCHSDAFTVAGAMGNEFPRSPGHEIAGEIDALGEGVTAWSPGQRVGVGWFGGCDFTCDSCRRGDFVTCSNGQVPGIAYDGGYAEYTVVPQEALAAIPDELQDVDAAPLLCAGVTTFNALRNSAARPGDVVAILGVGGLGHLAVQYAAKMGFVTVAIARGTEKKDLSLELGADHYIDSTAEDPSAKLRELGGASVVLATVTAPSAMTSVLGGIAPRGELVVVGASPEPMQIPPFALIPSALTVKGHASGTAQDSEDTMNFSAHSEVSPRIETMPLDQAQAAYDKMMAGDARFRMVLTMDQ